MNFAFLLSLWAPWEAVPKMELSTPEVCWRALGVTVCGQAGWNQHWAEGEVSCDAVSVGVLRPEGLFRVVLSWGE